VTELEGSIDEQAIATCYESSEDLEGYAMKVIKDLEHGDIFKLTLDIQKVIYNM